jgi:4-hydroxy-4-methyl-2-oxoglutarate aldolase
VLSTPLIADACVRLGVPVRVAPVGVLPIVSGQQVAGRVRPVRHYGSVDVFLEAYVRAAPGDVLVIDNAGRVDEACVGDLAVLEAESAGLAGVVIWGLHRDHPELVEIGLPVFSYGRNPLGPLRVDPRDDAPVRFGPDTVTGEDLVFGDDDGVLFVPAADASRVLATAERIRRVEREQADRIRAGDTLRKQTAFDEYLTLRDADPEYTFRKHLRRIGGAIEE